MKSYIEIIKDISDAELLKGFLAHGLFAEKIPNFLTSEYFYKNFIKRGKPKFEQNGRDYIRYESMRNINIPRSLSVPNPFAYANLCICCSENWVKIQKYFEKKVSKQSYKVSRIHLRKFEKGDHLFEMNYKHNDKDGTPEQEIFIKSRFKVEADISNCFPSIYSHSIPWALLGKEKAKKLKNDQKQWANILDKHLRNTKNEETNGILIGPHVSNLFSEIILSAIDKELWNKGYRYVRYIDDYTCFVESFEKAESFLIDLSSELKKFELALNSKKTKITPLPQPSDANWVNKLNNFYIGEKDSASKKEYFKLKKLKSFIDLAIELSLEKNDSAVLNYAFKVIASKELGKNALRYYINQVHHLLLSYPYLVHLMEEFVFEKYKIEKSEIKEIAQNLYDIGINKKLYEACSFPVFWSIKYNFDLEKEFVRDSLRSNDCIFMLVSFVKAKNKKMKDFVKDFKNKAKSLKEIDFERNWLFAYEVLPQTELTGEFKSMKKGKVSFIKKAYLKK